jgi:endoglucanase
LGSDAPPSGSAAPPSGGESAKDKTVNFTSGQFACTATQVGSWPVENGKTCYQYELSMRNTGASCPSWAVTMDFGRPISLANGWNGTFATEGSRLTIRSMDYDGSIAAGATLTGVGFQVVM